MRVQEAYLNISHTCNLKMSRPVRRKSISDIDSKVDLEKLKRLSHENILPVLKESFFEDKERKLVIFTQECQTNLREYMNNKILGTEEIREIGICLLNALDYLHNKAEIPHESIKPRNILQLNGKWKLAHFGIVFGKPKEDK